MKLVDLKRPINEMSSGGAVGGGAIASTTGGLGNWAPTVKKSKKKRKSKYGLTIIQREQRESVDTLFKNGYQDGYAKGVEEGRGDQWMRGDSSKWNPKFDSHHDPSKRGRITRQNAYEKGKMAGYQDGYYDGIIE